MCGYQCDKAVNKNATIQTREVIIMIRDMDNSNL